MPKRLQTVEVINPRERDRRLEQLLQKYHSSRRNRVIVFVLYKKEVMPCLIPALPAAVPHPWLCPRARGCSSLSRM